MMRDSKLSRRASMAGEDKEDMVTVDVGGKYSNGLEAEGGGGAKEGELLAGARGRKG